MRFSCDFTDCGVENSGAFEGSGRLAFSIDRAALAATLGTNTAAFTLRVSRPGANDFIGPFTVTF